MQVCESYFFSVFACWPTIEGCSMEDKLAVAVDPLIYEEDRYYALDDEPIDVSSLPTLELPDTVLFPDESVAGQVLGEAHCPRLELGG